MVSVLALLLLLQPWQVFPSPLYFTKRSTDLQPSLLRVPVLLPIYHQPNTVVSVRKKKGPNYPLTVQSIQHQLLVPNLHVIPVNQHLVSQTHSRNITHQLVPILIPIHNHLTVIPLQRNHVEKISHYRAMEKKEEDEEVNQFRTFYGGYGTGLFFGGHGAGHGFYAYG